MTNIFNNPLNERSITDRMSFNVGTAFSILLNTDNDASIPTMQHCLEYIARAFEAKETLVLPANIIHLVYKKAAAIDDCLIARALVCTASADWSSAHACVQSYIKNNTPVPVEEPHVPMTSTEIEDAEIVTE